MREKRPDTEFLLVRFQSEYRKIKTKKKNSVFGHYQLSGVLRAITEKYQV